MSENVVQVRIINSPRAYPYAVPDGVTLVNGDWVDLPGNVVSPGGCTGQVVGHGRRGYTGELKEIVSRLDSPDEALLRMAAARGRTEVRALWLRARERGASPERLMILKTAGDKRLRELADKIADDGWNA